MGRNQFLFCGWFDSRAAALFWMEPRDAPALKHVLNTCELGLMPVDSPSDDRGDAMPADT